MPRWMVLALLAPALLGYADIHRNGQTVTPNPPRVIFGREMVFSATVSAGSPVAAAKLLVADSSFQTSDYPGDISGSDGYQLSARRDLQADPVFPFSKVTYWWEIRLDSGDTLASEKQSVQYADDRFSWQSLEKGHATVRWVEGDARSAGNAADLLLLDLGTESADLSAPIPDDVELIMYPRLADFHSGLGKLASGWEGAVSDPAEGIILIAAAPGAEGRESIASLLPHEAAHILLGARWKAAYASLPVWLVEGIAAGYETEPRPEADGALRAAAAGGTLIPLAALCRSFPAEERPALLAYAESKSFVANLRTAYGPAALRQAMEAYAAGADCASGFFGSTGKRLATLEATWREGLTGSRTGMVSTWTLVLGAGIILAAVIILGWLLRRRKESSATERKTAE
jgi:hypothetical protein